MKSVSLAKEKNTMSESALPVWVTGLTSEKAGLIGRDAIYATAWSALSYAFFTGKLFAKAHPVLGTISAIFAVSNAAAIVVTATE
jgi:hypothetical protein